MSPGSPAFAPAILSTAVIPEHELLRPIASGAYGQVWLARNRLGVYRAVKIVHRASFDHERPFEREFAGIKAFEPISRSHEGLVDLLQVGRDDDAGYFYYVMELADGLESPKPETRDPKEGRSSKSESAARDDKVRSSVRALPSAFEPRFSEFYAPRTLAAELKRRGRLPLEECIQIGLSLTDALAYLHGQGLVHRDIKPSNIIFVNGEPKLADVGLVTGVGEAQSFVGTEGFIPPEGPGTPQADLYSLGIVLYVLSTGKSHQDFPEPPADLSAQPDHARWLEFNAVVDKACQAQVRERFQSAEQMRAELALLERGQSIKAKRATQRRWGVAKKLGLGAILLALVITALPFLKGAKHGHTPGPEAARLYERGQWFYNQLTTEDHKKAFEYLTRATQADPKFVEPYAELAGLYVWAMLPGLSSDQIRLERVKAIADRLVTIAPGSAEQHTASSICRYLERDWPGAETEVVKAIKANPRLPIPHYLYSFYLTILERTDEARREGQRADELSPPAAARVSAIVSAWPFMAERRYDLAIPQLKRVLELDRNFSQGRDYLGDCYEAQSNYVAAIDEFRSFALLDGRDPAKVNAAFDALRQAYDTSGQQGYFRKWIELLRADEALPEEQRVLFEWNIAGYYARLGEKQKALDELEKHFDDPNTWQQIKFLSENDSLRDEPRFQELVRRARLKP